MRIPLITSYQDNAEWDQRSDDVSQNDCVTKWENNANEIIELTAKLKSPQILQSFLFLKYGFWHDFSNLKNYLRVIHQHTFLSNETYLIIDRRIGKGQKKIDSDVLDKCFSELAELNFTDILQTNSDDMELTEYQFREIELLKTLTVISGKRSLILDEMLQEANLWKFDLSWARGEFRRFLSSCPNILSDEENEPFNTVLVLEEGWGKNQSLIKEELEKMPGKKMIAVCTTDVDEKLMDYAKANRFNVIRFSDFFDLRYFLHKYYTLHSLKLRLATENDYIIPQISHGSKNGVSLITSSLDPGNTDLLNHILNPQTARSVFELFGNHRRNSFVIPTVNAQNIKSVIAGIDRPISILVHFGHCNGTGIQNYDGTYCSIEDWINAFDVKIKDVRLAFFFSCQSNTIAQKFVESGGKMAIGFGKDVSIDGCMKLAQAVIPAILNGRSEHEIFDIFNQRCAFLGNDYQEECCPNIFPCR